jgi:4-hydroxy-tetrahydrodipicolinate synthase
MPFYAVGGHGCISVVSNVAPAGMAAMWDAAAAGDWARARQLHYQLFPLSEGLFIEANPIPVKAAMAMMGKIADEIRAPLYPMAGANRDKIKKILTDLKLI